MSFIESTTAQFQHVLSQASGNARFLRESAWEAFIARGLPTRKTENWRYSSLRLLDTQNASVVVPEQPKIPDEFYTIIMVDGVIDHNQSTFKMDGMKWEEGVVPGAAQIDPDKHPMAVLNLAMAQNGLNITIPAGLVVDKPIAIVHLNTGKSLYHQHRITLGEGAKASIISHVQGTGSTNNLVLVKLAANAQLSYYTANLNSTDAIQIEGLHAEQESGSTLDAFVLSVGSRLSRFDMSTAYLGAQASSKMNGVYSVKDKQHTDIHLNAEHIAPHCTTSQSVRGIADGASKAVFNGRVCVHSQAVKSFSEQSNHNLLLSSTAEVDTKPELEIYNDDVKCAHGATVGQLSEESLFYLMARGIAKNDALAMLRQAFVSQQFDLIQDSLLKDYLRSLFDSINGGGK